eukprot:SAG31_NODE_1822_length_7193_cov_3.631802_4_plen_156_part_00
MVFSGTFQPLQLGEVVNNTPPAPPPPPQCINKPPSTPVMCHPKQSGSTCPGGQRCPSCGRTRCECPSSLPPFGDACPGGLPCPNCSKSICKSVQKQKTIACHFAEISAHTRSLILSICLQLPTKSKRFTPTNMREHLQNARRSVCQWHCLCHASL